MTKFVSYQPQYFPRLHYFARILDSDIFGVADYIQFVRKHPYHQADGSSKIGPSYQAHTPIKTSNGVLLIDIPTKHSGLQSIGETKLGFASPKERLRNLRVIEAHYRTAPQFAHVFPRLRAFFTQQHESVADINIGSILFALGILLEVETAEAAAIDSIHTALAASDFRLRRIVPFSETPILPSDKEAGRDANDWLIDACRHFDADEYSYGGTAAGAYMDFSKFESAGISLVQQDWKLQPYPQLHGDFIPNLSIIDLLMNVPPEEARERLRAIA